MTSATIIISLLSGLAGAIVSTCIYLRRDKKMFKVQTLKKFGANRYDVLGDNFSQALNEIFVVFNDSPKVMKKLDNYHKIISKENGSSEPANDALVLLYKAMCDATKTNYKHLNDSFFLKPFNSKQIEQGHN